MGKKIQEIAKNFFQFEYNSERDLKVDGGIISVFEDRVGSFTLYVSKIENENYIKVFYFVSKIYVKNGDIVSDGQIVGRWRGNFSPKNEEIAILAKELDKKERAILLVEILKEWAGKDAARIIGFDYTNWEKIKNQDIEFSYDFYYENKMVFLKSVLGDWNYPFIKLGRKYPYNPFVYIISCKDMIDYVDR